MPFIYCITNVINNKQYVGKTTLTVEERFRNHCKDRKKRRNEKRPLYNAMNKYGVDNFVFETLIECTAEELSTYEQFYIDKLDTYKHGYNATKGGDGKILFDYKKIIELYQKGLTFEEISKQIGCCSDTVSNVIHGHNVPTKQHYTGSCQQPLKVVQCDKSNNQELRIFDSIAQAAHWLVDNGYIKTYCSGVRGHISSCCRGLIKTAYKFKWRFG